MKNEDLKALIDQQEQQLISLAHQVVGVYRQADQLRQAVDTSRRSLAVLQALVSGEETEDEELHQEVHNE